MADKEEKQRPKTAKEKEKILERKYKNYGIHKSSPSSSPTKLSEPSSYEVHNRKSGEKYVEFDEGEKSSYAPLTPEKTPAKGGLFSRIMKRLSLDKTKEDLATDGEEEEDVGYVQRWDEDAHDDEEAAVAPEEGGASSALGVDHLTQKFKGLDFGKDELTKEN